MSKIKGGLMGGTSGFGPLVDGYFLAEALIDTIRKGEYHKVPFIAGSNRDEFAFMTALDRKLNSAKPSRYEQMMREEWGFSEDEAKEVARLYPLEEFNNKPGKAYGRIRGVDTMLACPTYTGLAAASEHQADTWLYRFEFDDYLFGDLVGSAHAMEIPLIFDSMDRFPISIMYNKKIIKKARPLSDTMMGYWVNFAKTGDPNGPGLPEWPRYDNDKMMLQVLDTEVRSEAFPYTERCAYWDKHPFHDLR
jgi:para-nitrobenzyl esterase